MTNAMYIGILWLAYYALHSAFASESVKQFFAAHISFVAPYYRVIYSFFATVNFILLGWFHIIVPSGPVFDTGMVLIGMGILFSLAGSIVFWKSAKRYGKDFLLVEDYYNPADAGSLYRDGIHQLVRHPLYFGILLFLVALVLIFPSWKNLVFAFVSAAYIYIGASLEERKLARRYGEAYRKYQKEVRMLIPYLF